MRQEACLGMQVGWVHGRKVLTLIAIDLYTRVYYVRVSPIYPARLPEDATFLRGRKSGSQEACCPALKTGDGTYTVDSLGEETAARLKHSQY